MARMSRMLWSGGALLLLNLVALGVLGFQGRTTAAPKAETEAFGNPIEQRNEIINQLKELNKQIKEQTDLLRSGKLQVIAAPPGGNEPPK